MTARDRFSKAARRGASIALLMTAAWPALGGQAGASPGYRRLPEPASSEGPARRGVQAVVFGGGCFWGAQEVFAHLRGVRKVVAGYSGGDSSSANYRAVGSGTTGHVEAVEVTYDPAEISYKQLLTVFMSVIVDPTEVNGQGPDHGPQYSAVIFYDDAPTKALGAAYISQLNTSTFGGKVAVKMQANHGFFPAEPFHQNYAELHPRDAYILEIDAPKMDGLQRLFPELYLVKSP